MKNPSDAIRSSRSPSPTLSTPTATLTDEANAENKKRQDNQSQVSELLRKYGNGQLQSNTE